MKWGPMRMGATYSVVIPVFNEEEVLEESYRRIKEVLDGCGESYELIFVNDGSRDKTLSKLKDISSNDETVKYLSFSRNFGHQTAITAGMDFSTGAAVIVIDADLQDPPEVILEMMDKWKQGYDVVYGRRIKRRGETAFKKFTASAFYRFLRAMTDVNIPADTGDFRLISRRVCDALKSLPERNRYVRGLVSWVGFSQTAVDFVREERFAGTTKYPLKKMIRFASDAITSFSYKPLKAAVWMGSVLSIASLISLIVNIIKWIAGTYTVASYLATLVALCIFFNGIVLLMLGILGEYIGRIYDEAKGRPLYIVAEKAGFERDGQ